MKKPLTHFEACVQQVQRYYEFRMKDLKALKPQLDLLETFIPALHAKGVRLFESSTGLDLNWPRKPAVRLQPFFPDIRGATPPRALLNVLLELGFQEEARDVGACYVLFLMRHGKLRISFVTGPLEAPASPAPAAVEPEKK